MSGLQAGDPRPVEIRLLKKSRVLEISFDDRREFQFSFEFLRVFSPSAEVRGHGRGQETLQTGKRDVDVLDLEPVGNYAVRPRFSDGHDTGLYSWDYLYELGKNQEQMWRSYLDKLRDAGASRDTPGTGNAPLDPKLNWKSV